MSDPRPTRVCRFGALPRLVGRFAGLLASLSLAASLLWASGSPAKTGAESRTLVDPTKPAHLQYRNSTTPPAARAELKLSAIVVSEGRRVAVINGRRLGLGDRIHGARVVAIQPYRVQLEAAGKSFTLSLVQKPVHKRKVKSDR